MIVRFQHFKGGIYTGVSAQARLDGDPNVYVAYQGQDGQVWIREKGDFNALVTVEGHTLRRFTPMFDDVPDAPKPDSTYYNARMEKDGMNGPFYAVVPGENGEDVIRLQKDLHGTMHIYGRGAHHDDAYILGDRTALRMLRDAIDQALEKGHAATESLFPSDGEGYAVRVRLHDHDFTSPEWRIVAKDYEVDYAKETDPRAVYPIRDTEWAQLVEGEREFLTRMEDFHRLSATYYDIMTRIMGIVGFSEDPLGALEKLLGKATEFLLDAPHGVSVYTSKIDEGRWVISRTDSEVLLNKDGIWEPMVWAQTKEDAAAVLAFGERTRFASLDEATKAYEAWKESVRDS